MPWEGAVFVDSPVLDYPTGVFVQVANNTFNRNTATGGNGVIGWEGASGLGGSLQIGNPDSVNQPVSPTFFVIGNQFTRGGAYGGVGGSAYGGAVGFAANLMDEADFAFDENTVSGAVAQGGSGGGSAYGGGVYLDAGSSYGTAFSVETDTISGDEAIGGPGGDSGPNGLAGGNAAGGGIATDVQTAVYPQRTRQSSRSTTQVSQIARRLVDRAALGYRGFIRSVGKAAQAGTALGGGVFLNPGFSVSADFHRLHRSDGE